MSPYFPEIVGAVADALPAETVVDGELIVFDPLAGRTSFPALQARVTAGRRLPALVREQPACLVVFDVLEVAGDVVTGVPLAQRRPAGAAARRRAADLATVPADHRPR